METNWEATNLEIEKVIFNIKGETVVVNKVANFEELIIDPADPDQVPCWAEVWPASIGLASYIAQTGEVDGKEVLELGAGLGVPGVMAGLKGGLVTFSDFNSLSLDFCGLNARENGLVDYRLLLADWRKFPFPMQCQKVLGSDIMYEPRLLPFLKEVLQVFLQQGSELLLAHPGRSLSFSFVEELVPYSLEGKHWIDYLEVYMENSLFNYYRVAVHSLS